MRRGSEREKLNDTLARVRLRVIAELNSANDALPPDQRLWRSEIHEIADELVSAVREAPGWRRTKSRTMTSIRRGLLSLTRPIRQWQIARDLARQASGWDQETRCDFGSVRDDVARLPAAKRGEKPRIKAARSIRSPVGLQTLNHRKGDSLARTDNLTDLR